MKMPLRKYLIPFFSKREQVDDIKKAVVKGQLSLVCVWIPGNPAALKRMSKTETRFYLREILRSPMQWHSGGWLWTHEERWSKIHTGSLMLKHANLFHQWARQLLSFVYKPIMSWLERSFCHFLAVFDLQTAAGLFLVQSMKQQQGGKKYCDLDWQQSRQKSAGEKMQSLLCLFLPFVHE